MAKIVPHSASRVSELEANTIVHMHMSLLGPLSKWAFSTLFNGELTSIERHELHKYYDHTEASGNYLAYGENDIEIVGTITDASGIKRRAALLIEGKLDAPQGFKQAQRYQARAEYRKSHGDWDLYCCVLLAPAWYLEGAPKKGWDKTFSFEAVVAQLGVCENDKAVLSEAAKKSNMWNKPIPAAVQFWEDFQRFQKDIHPTIPTSVNRQKGAGIAVYPSFYVNQLRGNSEKPRRNRIRIDYPNTSDHISLFVQHVSYSDFSKAASPLLGDGVYLGAPGKSWQSVQIKTHQVDPLKSVEDQFESLNKLFLSAQKLFDFFEAHENTLISIPTRN